MNADLGNVAGAVPHYCEALQISREIADTEGELSVYINLGVALMYGSLYREAVPCFLRAADIASTFISDWDYQNTALTNLAQCYLYLGELPAAHEAICLSLARSAEPREAFSAASRVVREYTYVLIALELGLLDSAKAHAADAQRFASMSDMPRHRGLATIAHALCLVHENDEDEGIEALKGVLAVSGESSLRESTLSALMKAYDKADQPEQSLDCLSALLAHVRGRRGDTTSALLFQGSPIASFATEDQDLHALELRKANLKSRIAERRVIESQVELLERFAMTADLRDESSGEHGLRVGRLSALLATQIGWSKDAVHAVELGAKLHDIGKTGVPDRILFSKKSLEQAERHFVSAHTQIGAELLGKSQFPHVRVAEEIARHHHEWWNGEGYPSRLAGERIPKHARIVALADVFDALTHGRPYSAPWPFERALEEIRNRRGTQFDPELTDIFVQLLTDLHEKHGDLDAFLRKGMRDTPFAQARRRISAMLDAERNSASSAAGNVLPEPSTMQ